MKPVDLIPFGFLFLENVDLSLCNDGSDTIKEFKTLNDSCDQATQTSGIIYDEKFSYGRSYSGGGMDPLLDDAMICDVL
jgi:hypothetical protein